MKIYDVCINDKLFKKFEKKLLNLLKKKLKMILINLFIEKIN